MSKALFTFTIGPVKSLVENGRKMDDLYAGSQLLSELTRCAVEFIEGNEGRATKVEMIFPPASESFEGLPNRLVADIENYDEEQHRQLAKQLTKRVKDKFKEIYEAELSKLQNIPSNKLKIAYEQLEHFLEIYWLFEPYQSDEEYSEAYQKMFRNLHVIKSVRPFKQLNEPCGRKCSLHSEYNGMFVQKGNAPLHINDTSKIEIPENLKHQIKSNEALSAIAMVKRLYDNKTNKRISQRDMVFKKTLNDDKWYEENIKKKDDRTITQLTNAVYDVWTNKQLKYDPLKHEYLEETLEEAKELIKELKKDKPNFKVQQYYTLLKFDGDEMGAKYQYLKKNQHKELSEKICEFANKATKMIEEAGGICVYAGGEDVLTVVPLEEIWILLERLHEMFGEVVSVEGQERFTFSAGIAIAHLMQPLKDVMYQVSEAEKYAKAFEGKNSFAISLMKRGSETRTIRYSFANKYEQLEAFKNLVNQFKIDTNSKTFIYEISQVLQTLSPDVDQKMVKELMRQSLKSKKVASIDKILNRLETLSKNENTANLINMLNVVGFLSKEVQRNDVQN